MPKSTAIVLLAAMVSIALIGACEHSASDPTVTLSCSPSAKAIFLKSKEDDDDLDGNPDDENFPTIDDEDDDISDHAWVRDDSGVYHLFFHNEDKGAGSHIEHYISPDLQSLEYVGIALQPNPAGWDSRSLWAPHIIRSGGVYYMFYTGVTGSGATALQRIGVARSTDLFTWTRLAVNRCPGTSGDGCVYDCDEGWTTWGGPAGSFNQQCRDSFLIWDPASQRWLMFVTAKSVNQFGVVTVANSTDLVSWAGEGFIDATRRLPSGTGAQTTGGQAENPFVLLNDGVYYLFFTDWQDPEDTATVSIPRSVAQYASSSTLEADTLGSANWTYRGYIHDPGVNAIEVITVDNTPIMSQSVSDPFTCDCNPHRRHLRLRCVSFGANFTLETSNVMFMLNRRGFFINLLATGHVIR